MSDLMDNTGIREKRINPKRLARLPRQRAKRKKLRGGYNSSFVDKRAGNLPLHQ